MHKRVPLQVAPVPLQSPVLEGQKVTAGSEHITEVPMDLAPGTASQLASESGEMGPQGQARPKQSTTRLLSPMGLRALHFPLQLSGYCAQSARVYARLEHTSVSWGEQ